MTAHLTDRRQGGGSEFWCGERSLADTVDDPLEATCTDCLRAAATYGAEAAMRCAAVEAGAERDPEIEKERDEAIAALDRLRSILGENELFPCQGCDRLFHVQLMSFHVGLMAWCSECSASRGRIL